MKAILRKFQNKITVAFPEVPGSNIDECFTCNEDGHRRHWDLKQLMDNSESVSSDEAFWLIEILEKEYGSLKIVKRQHPKDYSQRFRRLAF